MVDYFLSDFKPELSMGLQIREKIEQMPVADEEKLCTAINVKDHLITG